MAIRWAKPALFRNRRLTGLSLLTLETLRELRNRIAHGHLLVRIKEVDKTPVLTLSLPRDFDATEAPDTWHLEFEELTTAHGELTAPIGEFQKFTVLT